VALTQTPRPNYPDGELPTIMGYSMRSDRYRYTEWRDFQTGKALATELYDHVDDPQETINLAAHDWSEGDCRRVGRYNWTQR
jgi:iduronate 2-sulfatase